MSLSRISDSLISIFVIAFVLWGSQLPRATPAFAQETLRSTPVDMRTTFTIAGIKLGMTVDQVSEAWSGLGKVVAIKNPCLDEQQKAIQAGLMAPPDGGTCVVNAQVFTNAYNVHAYFLEDLPEHPHVMRVFLIEYLQTIATTADRQQFASAVLQKYGRPSRGSLASLADWCNRSSVRQQCAFPGFTPYDSNGGQRPDVDMAFSFRPGQIEYEDFQYQARARSAYDRAVQATTSTKKIGL